MPVPCEHCLTVNPAYGWNDSVTKLWVSSLYIVCLSSVCAGDMPISLEQWRAAVGRWVARIQRTLIIRRGVKRPPSCASSHEGAPSPSGQSHSGERKCIGKRKGRKKHKDDFSRDPAITTDEGYDGIIALAATVMYFGSVMSKNCSQWKPVGTLKDLLEIIELGTLFVIIMILLRSGDVETNPGPVERGGLNG